MLTLCWSIWLEGNKIFHKYASPWFEVGDFLEFFLSSKEFAGLPLFVFSGIWLAVFGVTLVVYCVFFIFITFCTCIVDSVFTFL